MSTTESEPRKQVSGTSLTASGAIDVPPNAVAELGSALAETPREVVPELGSRRQALLKYQDMAKNDSAINVSLRAMKVPILGADYFVEPASEEPVDMEIMDFVRYNLLEGMNAPFLNALDDILHFFEDGFSILEPVYEQREWVPVRKGANRRKYTMLKKLAPRPALTIKEFLYDDQGGPSGVVQTARDSSGATKDVKIPIDKLVIFTFNKRGGNLEGASVLRSAYKHWYYKDVLYRIDAIQKERHALGVPYINLPVGYDKDDRDFALQLVRNFRTNETAGFVVPPGYEMGFAKPEGFLVDVIRSIEHHNAMIMMNTMAQFLLMGIAESGGGGRATSASHQTMYDKSLRYVASLICQYMNLYLIPPLVAYNFDTDKFPRLRVRNIGEGRDLQQWASAMANLASQGLITLDKDTEQWVRQTIDAPLKLGERPEDDAEDTIESTNGPQGNRRGEVQTNDLTSGQGNMGKGADES